MHLFISESERSQLLEKIGKQEQPVTAFYLALKSRVYERVNRKSLTGADDATSWYYPAAEYLSDAAMLYCLFPEENLGNWLRSVTLDIARASEHDWVGPAFRDHSQPYTGHLETAHLCWALASVLDLAKEVFKENEEAEVKLALGQKGMKLCRQWIMKNSHLANWRGIMLSGLVVSAAVLENTLLLDELIPLLKQCFEAFQPDGSYAESLQYGNYLAFALMLSYESLVRKYPERAVQLNIAAYGKGINWIVNSMLYAKPMEGWGTEPRARAVNFNDSAALFRSSGDLLLHLSARHQDAVEAGLAGYLFKNYYESVPEQGPHDLATFGMRNDWGFLTMPLLTHSIKQVSPLYAGLPLTASFSNGHGFMRDEWDGKTIVAINGGGDKLYGPGHLHGDVNSFILAHNNERLLADPGHSCYRNLIHGLESATQTHNTCTFLVEKDQLGLQEDLAKATLLEQKSVLARRQIIDGKAGVPIDRQSRNLITERNECISVIGSEAGGVYGDPVKCFSRLWILAGSHMLFVVDQIEASRPVTTVWNWLVNNRDGKAKYDFKEDILTVKRGAAAMKIFSSGDTNLGFPVYGYVHDAYHVEPSQPGEGRPGSGLLFRHTEKQSKQSRTVVHAFALDDPSAIDHWKMHWDGNICTLTNKQQTGILSFTDEASVNFQVEFAHKKWLVFKSEDGKFSLERV